MANPFLPLSLSAALVTGVGYGMVKMPDTSRSKTVAYDVEAQKASAIQWLVRNAATDDICLIEKTSQITATTATIDVDIACDSVMPDAMQVSVWQQDEAGNVTLGNDQGMPVVQFEPNAEGDLVAKVAGSGIFLLFPGS